MSPPSMGSTSVCPLPHTLKMHRIMCTHSTLALQKTIARCNSLRCCFKAAKLCFLSIAGPSASTLCSCCLRCAAKPTMRLLCRLRHASAATAMSQLSQNMSQGEAAPAHAPARPQNISRCAGQPRRMLPTLVCSLSEHLAGRGGDGHGAAAERPCRQISAGKAASQRAAAAGPRRRLAARARWPATQAAG